MAPDRRKGRNFSFLFFFWLLLSTLASGLGKAAEHPQSAFQAFIASAKVPVLRPSSFTKASREPLAHRFRLRSTWSITDERAEPLTSDPEVFSPSRARWAGFGSGLLPTACGHVFQEEPKAAEGELRGHLAFAVCCFVSLGDAGSIGPA